MQTQKLVCIWEPRWLLWTALSHHHWYFWNVFYYFTLILLSYSYFLSLDGRAFILVQFLDQEQPCVCCTGYVLGKTSWPEGRGGFNPVQASIGSPLPRNHGKPLSWVPSSCLPTEGWVSHEFQWWFSKAPKSNDIILSASSRVLLLRTPLSTATIPQRPQVSSTVLSASSFHSSSLKRL